MPQGVSQIRMMWKKQNQRLFLKSRLDKLLDQIRSIKESTHIHVLFLLLRRRGRRSGLIGRLGSRLGRGSGSSSWGSLSSWSRPSSNSSEEVGDAAALERLGNSFDESGVSVDSSSVEDGVEGVGSDLCALSREHEGGVADSQLFLFSHRFIIYQNINICHLDHPSCLSHFRPNQNTEIIHHPPSLFFRTRTKHHCLLNIQNPCKMLHILPSSHFSLCSIFISSAQYFRFIQFKKLNGYSDIMTESSSSSPKRRDRDRSRSEDRQQTSKLFITNLDGKADTIELETELRRLFEKCGAVESIVAKRNKNSEYCFAFAEMKDHAAAAECVKNYDQSSLNGKQIKVEFQDDSKRRKDSNKGCYNCGKMGHFARECHSSRPDERGSRHRGRYSHSRSRSDDSDRHKKPKRRHRSDSSERGRSRSPKSKKDRKNRSRDRDEKRKKKHKKSHSSDS